LVTLVGAFLSLIGITGIDPSVITGAVQGFLAVVTFIAALVTYVKHKNLVAQQ